MRVWYRVSRLDLEVRVLGTSENQASSAAEVRRRDEPPSPITHEDEQIVTARSVELLRHTVPALIASSRADGHRPPLLDELGGGLDLDANEVTAEVRDEVVEGAMEERLEDRISADGKPGNRRQLSEIALYS